MITPKEQLQKMTYLQQRIDQRLSLIEYYKEQAERMGGALKQVVVQSFGDPCRMESWVDKALDMAGDIVKEVDELRAERRLAIGIVEQIKNPKHRQVLELRYFSPSPPTWEEISEMMGLDLRWVYRLHGEALNEYGKITAPRHASKSHCHA